MKSQRICVLCGRRDQSNLLKLQGKRTDCKDVLKLLELMLNDESFCVKMDAMVGDNRSAICRSCRQKLVNHHDTRCSWQNFFKNMFPKYICPVPSSSPSPLSPDPNSTPPPRSNSSPTSKVLPTECHEPQAHKKQRTSTPGAKILLFDNNEKENTTPMRKTKRKVVTSPTPVSKVLPTECHELKAHKKQKKSTPVKKVLLFDNNEKENTTPTQKNKQSKVVTSPTSVSKVLPTVCHEPQAHKKQSILTPRAKRVLFGNNGKEGAFVNLHGGRGRNIEADLAQEHEVGRKKELIKLLGANKTEHAMLRITNASTALSLAGQNFDDALDQLERSSWHSKSRDKSDVGAIVAVYRDVKPFERGKLSSGLSSFKHSQFQKLDRVKFEEALRRNIERCVQGQTQECIEDELA